MNQIALMLLLGIVIALAIVRGIRSLQRTGRQAATHPGVIQSRPGQIIGLRPARRNERPGLYPIFAMAGGSAPVIPQLTASTINRKWVAEVNTGTTLAPIWSPLGGVKNFAPTTDDANLEDDGRYSDGGYSRMNKTGTGWNATVTVARAPKLLDGTAYDDAQEYIRAHGEGALGAAAQVGIRFYEFDPAAGSPRVQAYSGTAIVSWNEPGGERTGLSEATVTLTGQGQLLSISHPYPNTAVVPAIYSVAPGVGATFATAGGTPFRALGNHFTGVVGVGAAAVTFGGTNATSYTYWSDGEITGVAPAKTAGAQNVVITNATGASAPFAVTYA